jgi:hypothetical protein
MKKNRWQDWLNMLLGAWLFASPWLLKYADDLPRAAWSAWISGVAIVLFAAFALTIPKAVEEIANALLGVWVAVSPWVIGFAANKDATINAIFVGVLVLLLAIWAVEFGTNVEKWRNNDRHPA